MTAEDIKDIVRQVVAEELQVTVRCVTEFGSEKLYVKLHLGEEVISKDFEYLEGNS